MNIVISFLHSLLFHLSLSSKSAQRPITTPLGSERPWGRKLDGHLIVLGLAFLDGRKMTVDIDGQQVWFED